tara:strand:+ start:74 stop:346 length:273 start_codon:yes stop_codon:yes gene_type:complete
MDTLDIIKSGEYIVDAQARDDGFIEAVFCNDEAEQLFMYEPCLDKNDEPVFRPGVIPKPEMYKYHKKLKIWFHSKKTQLKFKKKATDDEQ